MVYFAIFSTTNDKILCFMDPHEMKMSYYVSVFGTLSGRSCCPEPPGVEDVADSPGGG